MTDDADQGTEASGDGESRSRSVDGLFGEKYPDSAFIKAVRELNPVRTSEVAETDSCEHETARLRLESLADVGQLDRRRLEVGEWSAWIWSVANSAK